MAIDGELSDHVGGEQLHCFLRLEEADLSERPSQELWETPDAQLGPKLLGDRSRVKPTSSLLATAKLTDAQIKMQGNFWKCLPPVWIVGAGSDPGRSRSRRQSAWRRFLLDQRPLGHHVALSPISNVPPDRQ